MYDIKKILIYTLSFGVFLFQLSCDDDGYNPDDFSIKGAKTQVDIDPDNSFFNFFDTDNAKVAFDLTIPAGEQNVNDIKLLIHYVDAETGAISDSVEFQTVSTFPSTVTITLKEAIDLIPGISMDNIKPGDTFDFSMQINTKSGQTLTRVSPRLQQNQTQNPYDFSPSFPVGCPSAIPEGVYSGETTGLVNTTKDVTVTNNGGGIYATSDMSAGALGALIGDPSYDGGGGFQDICNSILVPTYSPPGLIPVSQQAGNPGSYDEATGVITYNWEIAGIPFTTVLTPK